MKKKSSEMSASSHKKEKKAEKIPLKSKTAVSKNQPSEHEEFLNKIFDPNDLLNMLEGSLSANFISVPAGKIIYCNKAFLDLFDFKTKEEAFNFPVEKLYPSSTARINFLKELKAKKKLDGFEAEHITVDGKVIYTLENMVGVFDDSGELTKIMGNIVDITERKQAEERLRTSDQTYRGIINSIDEAIYIQDEHGTFLDVNDGAVKMYGYTREELIGKNPLFVSAEGKNDIPDVIQKVNLAFEGIPQEFEFWGKRKNGVIFPKSVRVYRGKYFERDVVIAIARDDTDRFLADQKLKESEELFRNLIENITDVFYVVDNHGRMKYCSPNLFALTGFSPQEILGHSYLRIVARTDRQRFKDYFLKETNAGTIDTTTESLVRRKDGTNFWAEQNTRIVRDKNGNVVEYRTVTRDITERKLAEDELRKKEDQMRLLVEGTPYLFFYTQNTSGLITYISPSVEKITGHPVESWYNQKHWFVTGNEINQVAKEKTHAHLNGDFTKNSILLEVKHAENHPILLEIFENPIKVNGVVVGLQGVARNITEQKQIEQKLKESEELFRNIVENISDVFYIVDKQGIMKYCSPNFFTITGFLPMEILGHQYVRIIAPVDRRQVIEHYINETKRGVLDTNLEVRVARKDGQIHWVEQNTRIVRDEKGEVLEYRNVARDITYRKHAEDALKKSEEWFRNLFEKASDGIFHLSPRGEILKVNKAFAVMHGYTVEEMQKMNLKDLDTPESSLLFPERMRRMLAGENLTFEVEHYHKNGHTFSLEVAASMVTVGSDRFFIAFHRDITERKQVENALRESETTFRRLFEESADSILLLDDTGFFACNQATVSLLGYSSKEEFLKKQPWEISPERQPDRMLSSEKAVLMIAKAEQQGYNRFEWIHIKADGTEFPVEVLLTPIVIKGKQVFHSIWRDITERKQAEDGLRASEERFRLISNLTSDYLFATKINEDGKVEFDWATGAFEKITGYTIEEYIAVGGWRAVVHPGDREKDLMDFQKLQRNEKVISEVRTIQKNGNVVWTRSYAHPIWDEKANRLAGIYGAAQDITQQKLAEEDLRKSELHFRSVWENSASGMRLTDKTGIITAVNSAFCQIVGKKKNELEGFRLEEIYTEPERASVREKHIQRFSERNVHKLVEKEFLLWNGKKVWLRVVNSFIESDAEKPLLLGVFTDITEQKISEMEIKKLSQAVEQSAGAIVITDVKGDIEYVNKKFEEISGYSFEEVKGKNPRILKSGDTSSDEYKKMWETILAGNEWRGTMHNKRKDGSLYWEATTVSPMKNKEGKITNFLAIKDDITQDKIKEEQLMKSELHFRSIWENSLDGMRLTDENGIIVSVNNAFAKLFEKDKNEIIGKPFPVVYGQNSGFNDINSFRTRFKERTITPFMDKDITLWNGKPMSLELTNSYVEIEGQSPLVLSIFRNVSDKKQSEQKIQLLAHSIESIGECISITDVNNCLLFVNDAFIKTYGYSREELIGSTINIIRPDGDSQENLQEIISTTIGGGWKGEVVNRRKDGTTFSAYLSTSVINDDEGNPIALIGVASDITDTKKSREELILAKVKAEEANKVKTNFLENMSHELRTPMIPILGFTELMEAMELPDEVKSMAAMMNKSANRLMDTLNIILDLAQIEKERVLLKPAQTNLLAIVEEVCGLFQPMAKEKNLYLRSEAAANALTINTDARILRHAINNLINNGLKFTQKGGVTIKLSTEDSGNENFAIIRVCDTGIGIPKDKQDIIWEEFRQGSEGIGRSFEGNGLGLTITKNFVEQLKGKVWVESEAGKGSTFIIKLPNVEQVISKEKELLKESVETVKPITKQEAPPDEKLLKKVLYVEDEEISFSVVKHFLKNKVSLDWARNGQDGVVLAKGNKYAAILMDINLAKGIDGMQTTKLIRELPQYKNTPIIAITAFAMRGDKEEFLGAGCSHYISKPFSKTALLDLIKEVFGEKAE
ncbi:MAG: PAS domain S-box protein [Ignavibacteria bacterium]|nr:PAS domain S-box protein [Ignavibacteria bacterium]